MSVKIKGMRTNGVTGKVKAFFTVALEAIDITDMRLIEGENGPFVAFPSRKYTTRDGQDKFQSLVSFARNSEGKLTDVAKQLQDTITAAALAEFQRRSGDSEDTSDDLPFK